MKNLAYFIFIVQLMFVIASKCISHKTNSSLYLGTKTPYRILQHNSRSPYLVPNGCSARQIWMFVRHGTRYPSSSVIFKMNEDLPKLRDKIIKMHSQGFGSLCEAELESFRNWSSQAEVSDEKRLAHEGEDEMADLAERMLDRLPELLEENYTNHSYKFRYTATQRTRKSARHFADGLFGRRISRYVWYPEPLGKDPVLRFYKLCSKWQTEIDDNPETALKERQAFESSTLYNKMKDDVAKRLGLPVISTDQARTMYATCAFESAWNKRAPSPWCAAFSENNLQVMEYAEDLEYYWTDGYGYDVNFKQACPPVNYLLQSFQKATSNELPKGIFHFTHSGALLKVMAYLGLYRDSEKLLHSNFNVHRHNRAWRVSRIDGFGSNLAAVLYRCSNENEDDRHQVLFLHQEQPVALPGCPSEPHSLLCPLRRLQQLYAECPFKRVCSLKHEQDDL